MTPGDFRRLALTLPGAIESAHIQGPRRAGERAQAASLTAPAISRHLRALRQVGLAE
ncbi:MAG: ArsR family transcriptional regulator [Gemmatimonadaceae bacterium]|nr:ArsR family transcriptional regulator [Caulobacter sp.]